MYFVNYLLLLLHMIVAYTFVLEGYFNCLKSFRTAFIKNSTQY